jgi:hypothetical protein
VTSPDHNSGSPAQANASKEHLDSIGVLFVFWGRAKFDSACCMVEFHPFLSATDIETIGLLNGKNVDAFGFEFIGVGENETRQAAQLFFDDANHGVARRGVNQIQIFIQLDLAGGQDALRCFALYRHDPKPALLIKARPSGHRFLTDVLKQVYCRYFFNFGINVFSAGHFRITSFWARCQASLKMSGGMDKFEPTSGP